MILIYFLIYSESAFAYIDPSASGVLLQFLATALGLILFNIKKIFRGIKNLFKKKKEDD